MNINDTDSTTPSLHQLNRSLQLLAFSLAQHRNKGDQIPLINALPFATNNGQADINSKIYSEGKDIYKQALALIESSLAPLGRSASLDEHRTQPRINVSTFISISVPDSGLTWQGNLTDISWGGLHIRTKEILGQANDIVNVSLPYPNDANIHIQATIVRVWKSDAMYSTAIRFSMLSRNNESKLNKLLELLLNETDDQLRKDVRFAHRIDISYWDVDELKATLEDISRGGMMITMPDPIELHKSIKVQLNGTDDAYCLSLRARVVRQESIEIADYEMYRIALQFEHPTGELRSMVHGLIQGMINKSKD